MLNLPLLINNYDKSCLKHGSEFSNHANLFVYDYPLQTDLTFGNHYGFERVGFKDSNIQTSLLT